MSAGYPGFGGANGTTPFIPPESPFSTPEERDLWASNNKDKLLNGSVNTTIVEIKGLAHYSWGGSSTPTTYDNTKWIPVIFDETGVINSSGSNIKSSSINFNDNIAFVDAFGQLVCDKQVSNISVNFADGTLDENFDIKTPILVGDGAATAVNGYAQVSSASSGSSTIESRDSLRYSNGRGFFAVFTASFEGSGVGTAGGFDSTDGFPLRYTGTTDTLEFGYLKSGIFTGAVEVDYAALGLDLTKMNIWAVIGGFLGVANPTLLVKRDTWKVAGVIKTEGVLTETHVRLPAFPIGIKAENNMTVRTGSWHGGTIGSAGGVQDRGFSYPSQPFSGATTGDNPSNAPRGQLTLTGSTSNTAFIIHSKVLFNSLPNKVRADIVNVRVQVIPQGAGDGIVEAQLIGNATSFSPLPVYSDISPSSVLEIDDNANAQATGRYVEGISGGFLVGEPIVIPYYGGQGSSQPQAGTAETLIQELQLDGIADETLTLIVRDLGSNAPIIRWYATWIERQI